MQGTSQFSVGTIGMKNCLVSASKKRLLLCEISSSAYILVAEIQLNAVPSFVTIEYELVCCGYPGSILSFTWNEQPQQQVRLCVETHLTIAPVIRLAYLHLSIGVLFF
jgi:hypothetical protein